MTKTVKPAPSNGEHREMEIGTQVIEIAFEPGRGPIFKAEVDNQDNVVRLWVRTAPLPMDFLDSLHDIVGEELMDVAAGKLEKLALAKLLRDALEEAERKRRAECELQRRRRALDSKVQS